MAHLVFFDENHRRVSVGEVTVVKCKMYVFDGFYNLEFYFGIKNTRGNIANACIEFSTPSANYITGFKASFSLPEPRTLSGKCVGFNRGKTLFNEAVKDGKAACFLETIRNVHDAPNFRVSVGTILAGEVVALEVKTCGRVNHTPTGDTISFPTYLFRNTTDMSNFKFDFQANWKTSGLVTHAFCSSQGANIKKSNNQVFFSLQNISESGDVTFRVSQERHSVSIAFDPLTKASGTAVMTTMEVKYRDDFDRQRAFILFIDCSDSMHFMDKNKKINDAVNAAELFVLSLPEDSCFQIYAFGSDWISAFPTLLKYNNSTMKSAIKWIRQLKDKNMGGTTLNDAFTNMFSICSATVDTSVIVITDGDISDFRELMYLVDKNCLQNNGCVNFPMLRILTIGIGDSVNRQDLITLSKKTHGFSFHLKDEDNLVKMILNALFTASTDSLKFPKLRFLRKDGSEVHTNNFLTPKTLLSGIPEVVFSKFMDNPSDVSRIELRGTMMMKNCEYVEYFDVTPTMSNDFDSNLLETHLAVQRITDADCSEKEFIAIEAHILYPNLTAFVIIDSLTRGESPLSTFTQSTPSTFTQSTPSTFTQSTPSTFTQTNASLISSLITNIDREYFCTRDCRVPNGAEGYMSSNKPTIRQSGTMVGPPAFRRRMLEPNCKRSSSQTTTKKVVSVLEDFKKSFMSRMHSIGNILSRETPKETFEVSDNEICNFMKSNGSFELDAKLLAIIDATDIKIKQLMGKHSCSKELAIYKLLIIYMEEPCRSFKYTHIVQKTLRYMDTLSKPIKT